MGIVHYPGEIKSYRWSASAAGADRPGMVVKIESATATDPRVCNVTASGDMPFGVLVADTYDQTGTLQSGSNVYASLVQEGEVLVAAQAGTYHPSEILYVADSADGYACVTPSGGQRVGIVTEYRVLATGDYTNKRDQIRAKLCLEKNAI